MSIPPSSPVRQTFQVVVGFDLSVLGERALEEAFSITMTRLPAEMHVVTVAQAYGSLATLPGRANAIPEEQAREAVRVRVAEVASRFQQRHGPMGIDRIAVYLLMASPSGNLAKPITELVSALDADLVVVGTHGRTGVQRALLGSVAAEVARHSDCSVYIVNPSDFVHGEKVPEVEAALEPGAPHLKHFEHRRTWHYVDKVPHWTSRMMPAV